MKLLPELICSLKSIENWSSESIKNACAIFAEMKQVKISVISQLLRAKVIGTFASPPLYEVLEILSQQEVIERLEAPLQ